MVTPSLSHWEQLKLLLWKNWCMQLGQPTQLLLTMLVPVMFFLLLVCIRIGVLPTKVEATDYEPIDIKKSIEPLFAEIIKRYIVFHSNQTNFTYSHYVPRLVLAYAPNTFLGIINIMSEASKDLSQLRLQGFDTCDEMRTKMSELYYFAGVCFNTKPFTRHPTESSYLIDQYPNQLQYTLIFPATLRLYKDIYVGANWNTDVQFDKILLHRNLMQTDNDGGYVGYIREGFIALQHAVTMAYIKLITQKKDDELPRIQIQRFPCIAFVEDVLQDNMGVSLSMTIVLGFLYPLTQLQKAIIAEKKRNLKLAMHRAGISYWVHHVAWLITGSCILSVTSVCIVVILKMTWNAGYSLLTYSSWSTLFIYLISYNFSAISFGIMISTFFSDIQTGCALSGILWLITYLPFPWTFLLPNFTRTWIFFPLTNSIMGFGLYAIIRLEQLNMGFQWQHFLNNDVYYEKVSLGLYILFFYVQCLIYLGVAVLVEKLRNIDIPMPRVVFDYLLERRIERHSRRYSDRPSKHSTGIHIRMTKVYEVDPHSTNPMVVFDGVTKEYDGQFAVNDVSMTLYENEIIALMGHNGSGKTMLLSMLTGLKKPDDGRILIMGIDIEDQEHRVYQLVGSNLNYTELFPDLTVYEQLRFFSLMRGQKDQQLMHRDIAMYIMKMRLYDHRQTLTRDLNVVLQKALAICCAMCGNAKVVVLDYPSVGMDMTMRTGFWDLLQRRKSGRTILMTCTSTVEAEAVADRIAIMSNGELKCYGSTFFLKLVYGYGFRLTLVKGPHCDVDQVTQLINKHIPKIKPECNLGWELSYAIRESYTDDIVNILADIEIEAEDMDIKSCEIRQATLDDIYYKMGAEDPSDGERIRHSEILNGITAYSDETDASATITKEERLHGLDLCALRWRALIRKRWVYNLSYTKGAIVQWLGPYLIVLLTTLLVRLGDSAHRLPTLYFELSQYDESIAVVEVNTVSEKQKELSDLYTRRIFWMSQNYKFELLENETFSDYIIPKERERLHYTNKVYQVAVSFRGPNEIIAWFNNYPLHTAPLSLNLVHNALIWSLLDANVRITVGSEPLYVQDYVKPCFARALMGTFTSIAIVMCVSFLVAFWNIFIVRERTSKFKFQQRVSGISYTQYWATAFTFDIVRHICMSVLLVWTMFLFSDDMYIRVWYWCILFLGGLAISSINYFLTIFFDDPINAYVSIALFNLFGSLSFCTVTEISNKGFRNPILFPLKFEYPFYIFPQFLLTQALCKVINIAEMHHVCQNDEITMLTVVLEDCKVLPKCCYPQYMWQSKTGINLEVWSLIAIIVVSWFIVIYNEYRTNKSYESIPDDYDESLYDEHVIDTSDRLNFDIAPEVSDETDRVGHVLASPDRTPFPVICHELGLIYPDHISLHRIFLLVKRGECFSLLGSNFSGKSSLLKILSGEINMTYGHVEMYGIRIKNDPNRVYDMISYSPEYMPYFHEYTGNEMLRFFCDLYGVPRTHAKDYIKSMVKMIGLLDHAHKRISQYSDGMKARLKIAIALLSDSPIILLDEPTVAIDTAGKRVIWNLIRRERSMGKTILLSSTNATECGVLCDRMAIMSSGKFWCIGPSHFLVNRYSNTYLLKLKIQQPSQFAKSPRNKIDNFMIEKYPDSKLKYSSNQSLVYAIPMNTDSMSSIFDTMHRNSFSLSIETIDITRDTLDFIFYEITATRTRIGYEKLVLLLWKNWCIHSSNPRHFLIGLLLPALFCSILVFLRFVTTVEMVPLTIYNAVDMSSAWTKLIAEMDRRKAVVDALLQAPEVPFNEFIAEPIIGYAPDKYEAFVKIMGMAKTLYLNNTRIIGFDNCFKLRRRMTHRFYLVGVCFSDTVMRMHPTETIHTVGGYPNHLTYTLIYPSTLRFYHETYIGETWYTDVLYNHIERREARFDPTDEGGFVGYIREGFISLQNAIAMSYIALITKRSNLPEVFIQRFPFYAHEHDTLLEGIHQNISLIIVVGYLYPVLHLVHLMITEKEKKLYFLMVTAGISKWYHCISWFLIGLLQLNIASSLVIVVLKIPWHQGHSILTHSSWSALVVFFALYNLATIAFCMVMSALFDRTNSAKVMGSIFWIVSYIPYPMHISAFRHFGINGINGINGTVKLYLLLPNVVMGSAFSRILQYESQGTGFTVSILVEQTEETTLYMILQLLLILGVMYLFCAFYFLKSQMYSSPFFMKFNSIILRRFPRFRRPLYKPRIGVRRHTEIQEVPQDHKIDTIRLHKVEKHIRDYVLIKDITFSMYRDEITALMGHNGSGKTLLVNLIVGLMRPTVGRVRINDRSPEEMVKSQFGNELGICFSNDALFEELTVEEQLLFFSRMKGYTVHDAKLEVSNYLIIMSLIRFRYTPTKFLSQGTRQLLAVCCALVGGASIIILDNPTTGMDSVSRNKIWRLLASKKFGRTILFTTNSSFEAENLADRMAILSGGKLKTYGSTSFLKEIYEIAYRLICIKDVNCDVSEVSQLIRQFVPHFVIECNLACELRYKFSSRHIDQFEKMLDELDVQKGELRLKSFSFRNIVLEDIYMRMGAEDPSEGYQKRHRQIMNGFSVYTREYHFVSFIEFQERLEGWRLFTQKCWSMVYKRIMRTYYTKSVIAIKLFLIGSVVWITIMSMTQYSVDTLPPLIFALKDYKTSRVLLHDATTKNASSRQMPNIVQSYRDSILWETNHFIEETGNTPMNSYVLAKQALHEDLFEKYYLIGATIGEGNITAWFNNFPLHTAPLALNWVHNAILRTLLDNDAKIKVLLDPLPFSNNRESSYKYVATAMFVILNLSICSTLIWSLHTVSLVAEQTSRFRFQQFVAGVQAKTYWIINFLYDICRGMIFASTVLLIITSFQTIIFTKMDVVLWLCLTIVVDAMCMQSVTYVISSCFESPLNALLTCALFNFTGTLCYCAIHEVFRKGYPNYLKKIHFNTWYFRIFPQYVFCNALNNIFNLAEAFDSCDIASVKMISVDLENCLIEPNCCEEKNIWTWDVGIQADYLNIFVITAIAWLLLYAIEQRKRLYRKPPPSDNEEAAFDDHCALHSENPMDGTPEQPILESAKVMTLRPTEHNQMGIVCDRVGKVYNNQTALHRFSLALDKNECFGLLGDSGSGKSTILKILACETNLSYGSFSIVGIRGATKNFQEIFKQIGYCPQYDNFIEDFVCYELMKMLCLAHGMPLKNIDTVIIGLSRLLGFYRHLYKVINTCSSGTKRRLSIACAMLNNPSVLILDEPGSLIDMAGSRQLWRLMDILRANGTTIMFSSLNIRQCELLCDRIGLISNGRLQNVGTLNDNDLYKDYCKLYMIRVRLRQFAREQRNSNKQAVEKMTIYFQNKFPKMKLRNHCANLVRFVVPSEDVKFSSLFASIHPFMDALHIESYSIRSASMSTLFMESIENQLNWAEVNRARGFDLC